MSDDFKLVRQVLAHYFSEEQAANYDIILANGPFSRALHEQLRELKEQYFDVRMIPNAMGVKVPILIPKVTDGEIASTAPTNPKMARGKKSAVAPKSDSPWGEGKSGAATFNVVKAAKQAEPEPQSADEAQFGPVIHQGYTKDRLRTMVKRDLIPICVQYGIPDYTRQPPDVLRSLILQHQEQNAAGEQLKCQVTGYPSSTLITVEENGVNYAVCPRVKEYVDVGWTVAQILEGTVEIVF